MNCIRSTFAVNIASSHAVIGERDRRLGGEFRMLTRRQFMQSSCALAGSAVLSKSALSNVPAGESTYRALVCIVLGGGADSFNMLVPASSSSYSHYLKRRGSLALAQDQLLPLKPGDGGGRSYALHHGLRELGALCDRGEATLVANVGPQGSPGSAVGKGLLQTLSHSELISRWHFGTIDHRLQSGWAGRVADLFVGSRFQGGVPTNISLSGRNVLQLGARSLAANLQTNPYRQAPGGYAGIDFSYLNEQLAARAINCRRSGPAHHGTNLLAQSEEQSGRLIRECIAGTPEMTTRFDRDLFSADLKQVAQLIAVRDRLGSRRQIFFVHFDGWDHHHNLLECQESLLPILSRGLAAFREALIEQDVFDDVTTFTLSEFGRSLESNGNGSDHGWGGHQIVMGGGVLGSRLYGEYPDLAHGNPLDMGGGCYMPTTSMDEYLAELVLWLGVPMADLSYVLPDFAGIGRAEILTPPLGMLA